MTIQLFHKQILLILLMLLKRGVKLKSYDYLTQIFPLRNVEIPLWNVECKVFCYSSFQFCSHLTFCHPSIGFILNSFWNFRLSLTWKKERKKESSFPDFENEVVFILTSLHQTLNTSNWDNISNRFLDSLLPTDWSFKIGDTH